MIIMVKMITKKYVQECLPEHQPEVPVLNRCRPENARLLYRSEVAPEHWICKELLCLPLILERLPQLAERRVDGDPRGGARRAKAFHYGHARDLLRVERREERPVLLLELHVLDR
jgi:hypothetical protein